MISCHNFPGEGQTEGNVEKCTDFKPTEKHGKRAFLANHFPLAWQVSWEDIANISWPARLKSMETWRHFPVESHTNIQLQTRSVGHLQHHKPRQQVESEAGNLRDVLVT